MLSGSVRYGVGDGILSRNSLRVMVIKVKHTEMAMKVTTKSCA